MAAQHVPRARADLEPNRRHTTAGRATHFSRVVVLFHAFWSMRRIIALSCLPGPGSMYDAIPELTRSMVLCSHLTGSHSGVEEWRLKREGEGTSRGATNGLN